MMVIITAIALVALLIGSYTDIRTREVPDWLNRGLVGVGIGLNLILSLVYSEWNYIINSLVGLSVFFLIALLLYYSGQWGGGDSKMIMGLGALVGVDVFNFNMFDSFLLSFLVNLMIIGSVYGLLWSIVMSIKNWKALMKEMKLLSSKKEHANLKRIFLLVLIAIFVALFFTDDSLIRFGLGFLALFPIIMFYIWLFVKSVEKVCMLKWVKPSELTEGDWIAKNVVFKKKILTGPKDLGIDKKKIVLLKKLYTEKKIGKVLVKNGIPFVPSFLLAFIVSLVFENLLFLFV